MELAYFMNGWFFMVNVGNYTNLMDPMGYNFATLNSQFSKSIRHLYAFHQILAMNLRDKKHAACI